MEELEVEVIDRKGIAMDLDAEFDKIYGNENPARENASPRSDLDAEFDKMYGDTQPAKPAPTWESGDGGAATMPEGQTNQWGGNLRTEGRKPLIRRDANGKVSGYSTTTSMGLTLPDGRIAVVPTVVDGKELSTEDAAKHYADTGEYWGMADNEEGAKKIARAVHDEHQKAYGKGWNEYIHKHWDEMSDEIRADAGVRGEHARRKRAKRMNELEVTPGDGVVKMTRGKSPGGISVTGGKEESGTRQVAPELFLTGDVLEDADGNAIKPGDEIAVYHKEGDGPFTGEAGQTARLMEYTGVNDDGKPVFKETEGVSSEGAMVVGKLHVRDDDFASMLGKGEGKVELSPGERVRLNLLAETGNYHRYDDTLSGAATAIADRIVPYGGRIGVNQSREQLRHLSNIYENILDEYPGKTDDEKRSVAAMDAGLEPIRKGESRDEYYARIRREAEEELRKRVIAKKEAGGKLSETEQGVLDKILTGGIESGGWMMEFALPGGAIFKGAKALGWGARAVRAATMLGSAVPVVAAESVSRYQENVTPEYGFDDNGEFRMVAAPDDEEEAAYKAIGGAMFDVGVEVGLEAVTMGLFRVAGKATGWALGKATPSAVREFGAKRFSKFMASETGQALRSINRAYQDFTLKTGISSPGWELGEENVQAFEKFLNLDGKTSEHKGFAKEWQDFKDNQLSWQTQWDIFYGLIAQLAIGSAKSTAEGVARHISEADARRDIRMALKRSRISDEAISMLTPKQQRTLDHMWRHYSSNPDELKAKVKNLGTSMRLAADELLSRESSKMAAELKRSGIEPEKFVTQTGEDGKPAFRQMMRFGSDGSKVPMNAMTDAAHGVTIVDQGGGTFYVMNDWRGLDAIPAYSFEEAQKKADEEVLRNQRKEADNEIAAQRLMELTDPENGPYRGRKVVSIPSEAALRWQVAQAVHDGKEIFGITRADQLFEADGSLKQPGAGGFHTPDGHIVVILDNVPSTAEMERVLAHEATGHEGVESATGRGAKTVEFIQNAQAEGFSKFVLAEQERAVQRFVAAGMDEATARMQVAAAMSTDEYAREAMARYAQGRLHQPTWYERRKHELNQRRRDAGENVPIDQSDLEVMLAEAEAKGAQGENELETLPGDSGVRYEEGATDEAGNGADEAQPQPEQGEERGQEAPRPEAGAEPGAEAPDAGVVGPSRTDNGGQNLNTAERPVPADSIGGDAEQQPMSESSFWNVMHRKGERRRVPVDSIKIPDTQFKENADPKTGVVKGQELGEYYENAENPIAIYERKDGTMEIVTGRHRLDAAKRSGWKDIDARIFREVDGYTPEDMRLYDAVANILDEKGTVKDYVRFFDESGFSEEDAKSSGILNRQKGRMAFGIVQNATDDTRGAIDWEGTGGDGLISAEQAAIIADAAPKQAALQRILVRRALDGVRGKKLAILARSLAEEAKRRKDAPKADSGTQLDLFTSEEDVALLQQEEKRADYRAKKANEYKRIAENLRTAMRKGGRLDLNKDYAKELGISDPKDKAQLAAARDKAVERANYWENAVRLDDADRAQMDADLGIAPKLSLESVTEKQLEEEKKKQEERDKIKEGLAKPIKGSGAVNVQPEMDLGQTGQQDLFSPIAKKPAPSDNRMARAKAAADRHVVVYGNGQKGTLADLIKNGGARLYPEKGLTVFDKGKPHVVTIGFQQFTPTKDELPYLVQLQKDYDAAHPDDVPPSQRKEPPKNAPASAPRAEGTTTPQKSADAPQGGKSAKNAAPAAKPEAAHPVSPVSTGEKPKKPSFKRGDKVFLKGTSDGQRVTFLKANADGTADVQVRTPGANRYAPEKVETRTVPMGDISATGMKDTLTDAERKRLAEGMKAEAAQTIVMPDADATKEVRDALDAIDFDTPEMGTREKQGALSGATSRPQVPAADTYGKKWKIFRPGTRNADIGAGRYELATEFLADIGVENIKFDPVNRDSETNRRAAEDIRANPADTATVNNVLNVIDNDAVMDGIINQAARAIKKNGTALFTIHPGSANKEGAKPGDRIGRQTKGGSYQRYWPAADYVPHIKKYFGHVETHGNVILAKQPKDVGPAFWAFDSTFDVGISFDTPDFDFEKFGRLVTGVGNLVDKLAKYGYSDFKSLSTYIYEQDAAKYERAKPVLQDIWNAVARARKLARVSDAQAEAIYAGIETPKSQTGEVSSPDTSVAEAPKPPPANKLMATRISDAADEIAALIERGEKFTRKDVTDIVERQLGGKVANGDFDAKQVTDIMELAINRYLKGNAFATPLKEESAENAVAAIQHIRNILSLIPTQTTRSVEQDKMQQFSTPPTEAFAAAWVANITDNDVMLEPSAGIGGIAVFGANAGAKVVLNELSPRRAEILEQLGIGKPFEHNAENLYAFLEPDIKAGKLKRPTVVVMNPPFSNSQRTDKKNTHIGADHVEQALKLLAPGGRLVAIVGNGMAHGKSAFKAWWDRIGREYTVRANVGVNGQEYAKYGTTFDNNIIVIDKVAPNGSIAPIYGTIESLDELPALLEGVRNDRPQIKNQKLDTRVDERIQQQAGGTEPVHSGGSLLPAGNNRDGSARPDGRRVSGGNGRGIGSGRSEGRGVADGRQAGESGERGLDKPLLEEGLAVQSVDQAREIADGTFSEYRPSKVSIPGMKPHPTALVESSAMASVQPPNPTYSPKIPKKIIEDGVLSEAQIEQVIYAGQAHEQMLGNGERKGYFIGDGTGVGKGREISGIILDNFNNGRRKAVWVSKTGDLSRDAKRDLEKLGLGGELFTLESKNLNSFTSRQHGVAFTTYSSLASEHEGIDANGVIRADPKAKGGSRMQLLAKWLGKDFDGVIVFDESHKAGNAISVKGKRGNTEPSDAALAVIDLQKILPNARIVYVSATGATEVRNLAYATRLGLWGKGTAFKDRDAFITQVSNGGISVMEIVARDMKAMGVYMARTLSYEGIEYERVTHELSPDQVKQYNLLAETWQMVMGEIESALISSGGIHGKANGNTKSAFWGAHQRFFNQTLTAMQMPSVLAKAREMWNAGYSPVFQLVSTNEATQKKALDKARKEGSFDVENLDLSPREILIGFVEQSFPTVQYVEEQTDGGKTEWRPLPDGNGGFVHDPAAVERKERLIGRLQRMKIGESPLDMILNEFGHENVAEITGRKSRREMVRNEDGEMEARMVKRTKNNSKHEADDFNDGKRTVLVFSGAGNTGFSFHADRNFKNQRRRAHFLIEAGYNAADAIQGLGRTHRSNESSHPLYVLCSTNLPGHKRFMSTIARRLAQLGSLTAGDRSSSGSGVFSEADNLENQYAKNAVLSIFEEMFMEDPAKFNRICTEMGFMKARVNSETGEREYVNTLVNEDGEFDPKAELDIPHFLNRILAMKIDAQNELFDEFSRRMADDIERAKENGTFDPGMEKLKGITVEVKNRTRLWEDAQKIGSTDIVEVGVTKKSRKTDYAKAKSQLEYYAADGAVPRVYTHNGSGDVLMMVETKQTRTMKDGSIVSLFRQLRPNGETGYTTETAVEKNYTQVTSDEEGAWTAAYEATPDLIEQSRFFANGTLLPIWDRLGAANPRFFKVAPTGGAETQTFLGMEIAPENVENVLARFGKSVGAVEVTPDVQLRRVMKDGKRVELQNGWTLKRVKVLGDNRIEIDGVDEDADVLRLAREPFAYSEKIGYLRVFLKPNAESMAQFLAEYPAVPDKGSLATASGTAQDLSGEKYKQPLKEFWSRIERATPADATALGDELRNFIVRLSSEQLGEVFDDYRVLDNDELSAAHVIRKLALNELEARGALDWRRREQAESESRGGDIVNFDTPGIYTASAADYANRDENGRVVNPPSLQYVGSGEGTFDEGWGLYGANSKSDVRMRGYAGLVKGTFKPISTANGTAKRPYFVGSEQYPRMMPVSARVLPDGKDLSQLTEIEREAAEAVEKAISQIGAETLSGGLVLPETDNLEKVLGDEADRVRKEARLIIFDSAMPSDKAMDVMIKIGQADFSKWKTRLPENSVHEHIYEQTFFTNRDEGDETHLINLSRGLTAEQKQWILNQAKRENLDLSSVDLDGNAHEVLSGLAEITGGPRNASEFLVRSDIDGTVRGNGLKYYVSFRDDNIRVDHKWTDGVLQFDTPELSPVTPAEDAAYMDAVERGDTETAQRMFYEALAKAPADIEVNGLYRYYVTDRPLGAGNMPDSNILARHDYAHGEKVDGSARTIWATIVTDHPLSRQEMQRKELMDVTEVSENARRSRLSDEDRYQEEDWDNLPEVPRPKSMKERAEMRDEIAKISKERIIAIKDWLKYSNDALLFRDSYGTYAIVTKDKWYSDSNGWRISYVKDRVVDNGIEHTPMYHDNTYPTKESAVVALDDNGNGGFRFIAGKDIPTRVIKSADAITRDDAGNVIPLSQRFNRENADIRFDTKNISQAPDLSPAEEAYAASDDKTPTEKVMREVYGMTNDEIATALRAAGMDPPPHVRKPDEVKWQQAEALLSNPTYMAKLSRAVAKFPRPLRDYEIDALNVLFRERQNVVNAAQGEVDDWKQTLDSIADGEAGAAEKKEDARKNLAAAQSGLARAKALMLETGKAKIGGASEQGRGLRANRGSLYQDDLTYAGITGEIAQIVGGADRITPEMDAQIRDLAKLFEDLDAAGRRIATERAKPIVEKIIAQTKNGLKVRKATERRFGDEAKRVARNYENALIQIEVGAVETGGTLIGMTDKMHDGWRKWLNALGEFHCFENPDITEEEVVNAILEDISPFMDGVDADQVRDVISNLGHNYKMSRYDSQRLMNSLRNISRYKRQIDWMDETNTMPPATGPIRDEPTQDEREWAKKVRERKAEVPDAGRDERRLKGVLDSIKKRLENRIEELKRAVETGERIPAAKRKVIDDLRVRELRAEKDEWQKRYDELFGTTRTLTPEQKIAMAEKTLNRMLEADLVDLDRARQGDFSKVEGRPAVTEQYIRRLERQTEKGYKTDSPALQTLRERRIETLKAIFELKKAKYEFGMTPEEVEALNARKIAAREKAVARLAERVATGDFRTGKPQPPMTPDQQKRYDELGEQMKRGRQKLAELRLEAENATVPTFWRRAGNFLRFVTTAQRALRATMDFSAVLRQAARMTLAHPAKAARAFGRAWTAARSEASLQDVNDEIMSDPTVQEAVNKYGLHLREVDATSARDVEMFHGMERNRIKLFGKEFVITDIPFFGEFMLKSERHYLTYLNAMSAEIYTSIVNDARRFPGGATPWQKKMVADMVNIWNGSAALSKERRQALQKAWVNDIFWAPQLAISRVQSAVGYDWWHPLTAKGMKNADGGFDAVTGAERRAAAKAGLSEHMRSTIAILAIGALLKWMFSDDDDKYNFSQADWFEKMMMLVSPKIGNTTIDFTGGESTFDKLVHQLATKSKRTGTGRLQKFGEFNGPSVWGAIGRYLQGKLSPSVSTVTALWEGKDYVGDEYGVGKMTQEMLIPLTFEDVKDQIVQNGIGKSLVTVPLTLLGAGGSTYDRKPYENAVNRFLEEKRAYDAISKDAELTQSERKELLDGMKSESPLMADSVRGDIDARIKAVNRLERKAKDIEKKGGTPTASLTNEIERQKSILLDKIRRSRRK